MNAWAISVPTTLLVSIKSIPINANVNQVTLEVGARRISMNVTQIHAKTRFPVEIVSMISNVAATKVTRENSVKYVKRQQIATLVMVVVWVISFSTTPEH